MLLRSEDFEQKQANLDAENELQEIYYQEEHIEDVKDFEQRQAILDAENELQEIYYQEEHIEDVKLVPSSILINTPSPTRTHIPDNAPMKALYIYVTQSKENTKKDPDVTLSEEQKPCSTPSREQLVSKPLEIIQTSPVLTRTTKKPSRKKGEKTSRITRTGNTPSTTSTMQKSKTPL